MRFVIVHNAPGINASYRIGRNQDKGFLFKSQTATDWANDAALQIGSQAGVQDWKDIYPYYAVRITFTNLNLDVDAPIKIILDTLSRKLGFNDKRIRALCIEKIESEKDEVIIDLESYEQR